MTLNATLKGKAYPQLRFRVTPEALRKYAAATNEVNPSFGGQSPIAPPAFPIVAAGESIRTVIYDPELEVNIARLVQGEQEHIFARPLKAGDDLSVQSILGEVTNGEAGESFTVVTTLSDESGAPVVALRSLMVIRGSGGKRPPPDPGSFGEGGEPEDAFEVTEQVDEDQTYRYAEASGDHNKIHIDPEYARNEAGMPGIIVHGMCTMAFASRAVLDSAARGDPTRLKSIRVQFSRPVFPGQALTTKGWFESENDGSTTYAFETTNPRGQAVIKEGRAVLSS